MLQLTIHNLPSLHSRDSQSRELLRQEVATAYACSGTRLPRRFYQTTLEIHHHWLKPDGTPETRNSDNITKPLLDALQAATGINDCYFDGWGEGLLIRKVNTTGQPWCLVTLWPA